MVTMRTPCRASRREMIWLVRRPAAVRSADRCDPADLSQLSRPSFRRNPQAFARVAGGASDLAEIERDLLVCQTGDPDQVALDRQSALPATDRNRSGVFLYLIAIINLVILVGIVKVFRRMRTGELDEAALEEQLSKRGFRNRILSGATKAVTKPWQMYPIGLLFGLGFDTATEVSLLVLAGGAAAFSLPWYAVLTLPVLFAAGMSKLSITTGPLVAIADIDLNYAGYGIVATWLLALAIWKYGRTEQKWTAHLDPAD